MLHTHGRNGQYHPHLHVLATSGGYEAQGARWEHLQYLPYDLLRRKWQWHLLSTVRKTLATDAIKQLVDVCFNPHGQAISDLLKRVTFPDDNVALLLNPEDKEYSFGINLLRCRDITDLTEVTYTYTRAYNVQPFPAKAYAIENK